MNPREFHLDMGPCHARVRLHGLPEPVLDVFPRTRAQTTPTLTIDLHAPRGLPPEKGGAPATRTENGIEIRTEFISGRYDPRTTTGSFVLGAPDKRLRSLERRTYSALRLAFSLWLFESGGITLHGCSLVKKDKAFVFLGESGSGKTTLVRSFPGDYVLGDDLVAILPTADGLHVWGTPFSGRERTQTELMARKLAGIALLSRGSKTQAVQLPTGAAIEGILRHTFAHIADTPHRHELLNRASLLNKRVPVYSLAFHQEQSPWSLGVFR